MLLGEPYDKLQVTNTLFDADDGVNETDKVFDAATNEFDVVVLSVLSVAVTTCNI